MTSTALRHPAPSSSTSSASFAPSAAPGKRAALQRLLPGLALSGALAAAALALGRIAWLAHHGLSALTLAIVLGMVLGNTLYPRWAAASGVGVAFSRQTLLRLGVVLYGLRLTMQDIHQVGVAGVATDALVLSSTFGLACWIGIRWLGLDRKTAMLIGAGSSICGAAAVMATEPVLRARAEQVTVAVATVVVFGTLSIFLYPALYALNQQWSLIPGGASGFGLYAGSTIHEVAQVVAAARAISPQAADTAVIAKMVRVMMLAPFLLALSAWLARHPEHASATPAHPSTAQKNRLAVPWFAFAFVGVVLLNSLLGSLHLRPAGLMDAATGLDTVLLAMAMAALGLSTHVASIRQAGFKPLVLALILFVWLVVGGALINHAMAALLG